MWVPTGPLWCWNVQGADAVFFSQPTHYWAGGRTVQVAPRGPLTARCQLQSWLEEHDGTGRTHPIQCGYVAGLTPDGTYLCERHATTYNDDELVCAWCNELQAAGSTKFCPGCHAIWRAAGMPDWCCGEEG
jgi:hypothetical protein